MPHMIPLTATRQIPLGRADGPDIWTGLDRDDDIADIRHLITALLREVREKPLWNLGWQVAAWAGYHTIFRPFGRHGQECRHLHRLIGGHTISARDWLTLQRLYTLAHAGCSAVVAWDRDQQRMIHFRSLDWPEAGAIARASRILHDPAMDIRALALAGMVGLLTAVKPGFSAAINFAPWRGPSIRPGVEPTFLLRQLMATATSFADAQARIARWRPASPVFVTLCGTRRGEGCCYQFGTNGRHHRVDMGESDTLVQTNHFHDDGPFARQAMPQAGPFADGSPDWDAHEILNTSRGRADVLNRELADSLADGATPSIEAECRRIFSIRPLWNPETAQWAVMVPATGQMRAWVRGEE